tara:strand:+ start:805 stop:1281 length:477 start_codon:yes stop_codon:yes gene_type:complete
VEVLRNYKKDLDYSPSIILGRSGSISAYIDDFGNKILYSDNEYQITCNSFTTPEWVKLWSLSHDNKNLVGELLCRTKMLFNAKYVSVIDISIDAEHRGKGFSYRLYNSLLSNLPIDYRGMVDNYKDKTNKKRAFKIFKNLGGFLNTSGYLEIPNPKNT